MKSALLIIVFTTALCLPRSHAATISFHIDTPSAVQAYTTLPPFGYFSTDAIPMDATVTASTGLSQSYARAAFFLTTDALGLVHFSGLGIGIGAYDARFQVNQGVHLVSDTPFYYSLAISTNASPGVQSGFGAFQTAVLSVDGQPHSGAEIGLAQPGDYLMNGSVGGAQLGPDFSGSYSFDLQAVPAQEGSINPFTAAPEPSTAALGLVGLAVITSRRNRHRRVA